MLETPAQSSPILLKDASRKEDKLPGARASRPLTETLVVPLVVETELFTVRAADGNPVCARDDKYIHFTVGENTLPYWMT